MENLEKKLMTKNAYRERGKAKCHVCGKIKFVGNNGLCEECDFTAKQMVERGLPSKRKLTKLEKKKFWKIKGRQCEQCGLEPTTGGAKIAIHPFRPIDWDGDLSKLKALCPTCLGIEAGKRDRLMKVVKDGKPKKEGL